MTTTPSKGIPNFVTERHFECRGISEVLLLVHTLHNWNPERDSIRTARQIYSKHPLAKFIVSPVDIGYDSLLLQVAPTYLLVCPEKLSQALVDQNLYAAIQLIAFAMGMRSILHTEDEKPRSITNFFKNLLRRPQKVEEIPDVAKEVLTTAITPAVAPNPVLIDVSRTIESPVMESEQPTSDVLENYLWKTASVVEVAAYFKVQEAMIESYRTLEDESLLMLSARMNCPNRVSLFLRICPKLMTDSILKYISAIQDPSLIARAIATTVNASNERPIVYAMINDILTNNGLGVSILLNEGLNIPWAFAAMTSDVIMTVVEPIGLNPSDSFVTVYEFIRLRNLKGK